MKILKFLVFLIGVFSICILISSKWIVEHFGRVSFEDILMTLFLPVSDGFETFKESITTYSFYTLICIFIWWVVAYKPNFIYQPFKLILANKKGHTIFITLTAIASIFVANNQLDKKFAFKEFLKNKNLDSKTDFFEKHYSLPKNLEFKNGKKNIVIVLAESFESSFYNLSNGENYAPNLEALAIAKQNNQNMLMIDHASNTISALTAWFFGVPIKISPNFLNYANFDNSFKNTISVFDILKENGYEMRAIMGSEASFANTGKLFLTHGFSKIKDKKYFDENLFNQDENLGVWGYNDIFIFEQSVKELDELKQQEKPFVLFISTMDTHLTNKRPFQKYYGDYRDAIIHSDKAISSFLKEIENIKNTAIIAIGDHLSPRIVPGLPKERRIFNVFFGNIPQISQSKTTEAICALDIAASILHSSGASWHNGNFGIGTSIFSEQKSLLSILGEKQFNRELNSFSKYYLEIMK